MHSLPPPIVLLLMITDHNHSSPSSGKSRKLGNFFCGSTLRCDDPPDAFELILRSLALASFDVLSFSRDIAVTASIDARSFCLALNVLSLWLVYNRLFLASKLPRCRIHGLFMASCDVSRFEGSVTRSFRTRSFASSETCDQLSSGNSYWPKTMDRNSCFCVLPMNGRSPPNSR